MNISIDWPIAFAVVAVCAAAYTALNWLERQARRRLAARQQPAGDPKGTSGALYDIVNPDERAEDFAERYTGKPVLHYANAVHDIYDRPKGGLT